MFAKPLNKIQLLSTYLMVFGIANIASSIVVPVFFRSLLWTPYNFATDLMVGSIYLAIGVVMVSISKEPMRHKGFIDFLILANLLHASVMVIWAQKASHVYIDAVFIGETGVVPLILYPWSLSNFLRYDV